MLAFSKKKIIFIAAVFVVAGLIVFALLVLLAPPQYASLSVSVKGASGAALEGVQLTVSLDGAILLQGTSSGTPLEFHNLPKGKRVTVRANKQGFEETLQRITLKEENSLELTLSAAGEAGGAQETESADFLIVSRKDRLLTKYGAALASQIINKMNDLAEISSKKGLSAKALLLDSRGAVASEDDVVVANELLSNYSARYLLIVGGPQIVFMPKVGNPLADSPYAEPMQFLVIADPEVWSDAPYGASGNCFACSSVAVGRLPDGFEEQSDSQELLDLLDEAIQAHSASFAGQGVAKLVSEDSFFDFLNKLAFESQVIPASLTPPFFVLRVFDSFYSPSSIDELKAKLSQQIVFIALHGNEPQQEQAFFGRKKEGGDEEFLVLNPLIAGNLEFEGKVVVADSCYGASPERLFNQSLPIQFMQKGSLAFIGSTVSALSDNKLKTVTVVDEQAIESAGVANALTYFTLKNIANGARFGDALLEAKKKLGPREVDKLTGYEFVLYGDPTLKLG